ncbi:hypothetical protein FGE12_09530 [Aggregicoccus sp. 17bor-14]|uniref:adventurous gliding motility lipoprotein CglD n=1 Tax=Myxococcaceae TaxID=31 RepID=UPI00129CF140|nr:MULTISPECIES: adventurous gliding motility lipoprotein CglD [Myxococcaceae]MBF5042640.1 hypothetical protein [Simulacricoccus sp. 17bor-14]MRI88408.1 hypothetical protein [Aggregicoccus sp. 17bor-14]
MNMRGLFRAALLASVLTAAAACSGGGDGTDPVDSGTPDGGGPVITPTATDSDGDGIPNSVEDKNGNGRVDEGETDPNSRDTDCDGLLDGPSQGSMKGEDQNANGTVDPGETDPTKLDTDGDGLTDGVERGVTQNLEPSRCTTFVADADPATVSDPTKADSDGDGMQDGAEDGNQNGKVDPGELDPGKSGDASPLVAQVCSTNNLKPVTVKKLSAPDLTLGLPSTFSDAELKDMVVSSAVKGTIGYDPDSKVAFIAYKTGQVGTSTTPDKDEEGLRATIGAGAPSTRQNFTTWDGTAATQAFYASTATTDLVAYANSLATSLVGSGAGALTGTAGISGPFKIQAEFVHRSNQSVIVVLAISSAARFDDASLPSRLVIEDVAGGTGLAQYVDTNSVQCEPFVTGRGKVDFLFVVDDSGSMATSQDFLAKAATDVAAKLGASSLDWRIGMVTTSYTTSGEPNTNVFRGYTTNIDQFKAWLTPKAYCASATNMCVVLGTANSTSCTSNSQCTGGTLCDTGIGKCAPISSTLANTTCSANTECWVNIDGTPTEKSLDAAREGLKFSCGSVATGAQKARPDAIPVVVLLTDTRDQSTDSVAAFNTFFQTGNPANQSIAVHGIICPPDGARCDSQEDNTNPRHADVIAQTSGVVGSIRDAANITATINGIVDSTIAAAGYKLAKPPIGASVRVGLESVTNPTACPSNTDLPRSRVNGFDVNGVSKTLSFYGACRPASTGTGNAAVSYRYWVDGKSDPDGKAPCFEDPKYDPNDPDHCQGKLSCDTATTNTCICKAPVAGCPSGQVFDNRTTVCACVTPIG